MLKFWGDGSTAAKELVKAIAVRSTDNFNWTFIFILAVVFYVYWTEVKNKAFYYIVTCADDERESQERTIECFRGYADCVEGAVEKGVVYGIGVYRSGEIKNSPAFAQAYEMGKSV